MPLSRGKPPESSETTYDPLSWKKFERIRMKRREKTLEARREKASSRSLSWVSRTFSSRRNIGLISRRNSFNSLPAESADASTSLPDHEAAQKPFQPYPTNPESGSIISIRSSLKSRISIAYRSPSRNRSFVVTKNHISVVSQSGSQPAPESRRRLSLGSILTTDKQLHSRNSVDNFPYSSPTQQDEATQTVETPEAFTLQHLLTPVDPAPEAFALQHLPTPVDPAQFTPLSPKRSLKRKSTSPSFQEVNFKAHVHSTGMNENSKVDFGEENVKLPSLPANLARPEMSDLSGVSPSIMPETDPRITPLENGLVRLRWKCVRNLCHHSWVQ